MTLDEMARERFATCNHVRGNSPLCPNCATALIRDWHAAVLREALVREGSVPVPTRWMKELRQYCADRPDSPVSAADARFLFAAFDFALARYLALEGILDDYRLDHTHLIEDGRRRERAEIAKWVGEAIAAVDYSIELGTRMGRSGSPPCGDTLEQWQRRQNNHHGQRAGFEKLAAYLASRGPAPDPLPTDAARQRVKELEATVALIAGSVAPHYVSLFAANDKLQEICGVAREVLKLMDAAP